MKPYEFYQRRIYKDYKDLKEEEVRSWSFYNGRSNEYGVNLRELNNSKSKEPTYKEIFNAQRNSLTSLVHKLENNNSEFYEMYRFISDQSKSIIEALTKEDNKNYKKYTTIKTSETRLRDIIKIIKDDKGNSEYIKETKKKIKKIKDPIAKEKAIKLLDDNDKAQIVNRLNSDNLMKGKIEGWINQVMGEYQALIDSYKDIESTIISSRYHGASKTVDWDEWESHRQKLWNKVKEMEKQVEQMKNWNPDSKEDKEELIKFAQDILNEEALNKVIDLMHGAATYLAGEAGEYVIYYILNRAMSTMDSIGKGYLGIINTGNLRVPGTKRKLWFDHIIVTSKNANIEIKYKVNNGKEITKKLWEFCADLEDISKQGFGEYIVEISNLDDLIKNNKLTGYTIQTKFRNDPDSITNNPEYTINELIKEGLSGSSSAMEKYARQLDLFVKWYENSQKYHKKKHNDKRGWVYATYTPEGSDNSTDLYERYFNYLLSREEVIEKIYGASVFIFITTGGVQSLQSYLSNKLQKELNPNSRKGYSLISAASVVDLSQANTKKISISINSNLHKFNKDNNSN